MKLKPIINYLDDEIESIETEMLGLVDSNINMPFLTFVEDKKYIDIANQNKFAKFILIKSDHINFLKNDKIYIKTDYPKISFYKLLDYLNNKKGYEKKNIIHRSAKIHNRALINGNNINIGKNTIIEANAIINEFSNIGDNCIIRSGSIIGGEQLELKKDINLSIFSIKHKGGVLIENDVEIGYGTVVDRGLFEYENTTIKKNTKIGNNSLIGHCSIIGKSNMIMSNVVIGGSICINDHNWIGANSVLSHKIKIGSHTHISMGSCLFDDLNDHEKYILNRKIKKNIF